jgi:hypothetical protein
VGANGLIQFLIEASKYMSDSDLEVVRLGLFEVIEAYRVKLEAKKIKPCAAILRLISKDETEGDP